MRALTREIADTHSPVRQFFNERFANTAAIQRRYRQQHPATLWVEGNTANPGTVGTAADWLLRFLLHPQPDLSLATTPAARISPAMTQAVADLAAQIGATDTHSRAPADTFTGPMPGNDTDPELLARGCWALAVLTEVFRAGPAVLAHGPLAAYRHPTARSPLDQPAVTAAQLLDLAPTAGLQQLAGLPRVWLTPDL